MTAEFQPMTSALRTRLLLLLAVTATAVVYWPGLSGPYLFDDFWNLAPVDRWHADEQGFLTTLLPNRDSIIDSRPMAMASFMLTTWLGGVGTFPLKLGNLVLHIFCGLLGGRLLHRILRLDARLAPHASAIASVMTTLWLLHPLHVSTVLYAVQRMTQLAALFSLAAIMMYLIARRQLDAGRHRLAEFNLFFTFPLLLALGVLSKQNAATAGLICLMLELAYFHGRTERRRVLVGFFGLFVALPALVITMVLVFAPQHLLGGYAGWDFTLSQRLLTQPRALLDYIGMWFVPRSPQMGLYTDDFSVSTDWLSPPMTLLAMLVLTAMSVFAVAMRKRAPSVFAGWFFFLAAHAVESSFLPIEMYYEHRNYLPSFGLLLMAAGLATVVKRSPRMRIPPRRLTTLVFGAFALALAFSTLGRALVWQDEMSMLTQGLREHPESFRARLDLTTLHLRNKDYTAAQATLVPLRDSRNPRHRLVVELDLVAVGCARGERADRAALNRAAHNARQMITIYEVHSVRQLDSLVAIGKCVDSAELIASTFSTLLEAAATQPEADHGKMHVRKMTAQIYARAGNWAEAERHARIGWEGNADPPTGGLLVRIYVHNGKHQRAHAVFNVLQATIPSFDTEGQQELENLRSLLRIPFD